MDLFSDGSKARVSVPIHHLAISDAHVCYKHKLYIQRDPLSLISDLEGMLHMQPHIYCAHTHTHTHTALPLPSQPPLSSSILHSSQNLKNRLIIIAGVLPSL